MRSLVFLATPILITGLYSSSPNLDSSSPPELVVDRSEVSIDQSLGLRVVDGKPFTGDAIRRDASGLITSIEQFKDGRRDGFIRKYFPNGQLNYEAYFVNGKREGLARSWWSNGILRSKTEFREDKAEGVAWSWYQTGDKFKRYTYEDGAPSGLQQAWRKNGKLYSNYEYRNGRVYGLKRAELCVGLEDEKISFDY